MTEKEPIYEESEPEEHIPHDLDIWTEEELAIRALVDEMYRRLKF